MTEQHKHCVVCGIVVHLLADQSLCKECLQRGQQMIAAIKRRNDKLKAR